MDSRNHPRSTSSMPIEIPRRRTNASRSGSPYEFPMSPDLIFEMSPVSPEIASHHHHSAFSDASSPEPFMYSFPKISPHRIHTKPRIPLQPLKQSQYSENGSPSAQDLASSENDRSILSRRSEHDKQFLAPPLTYSATTIAKSSASPTKITGFTPATPFSIQGHATIRPKSKRLSPPPRTSSYSSSPWILPGKTDMQHGESGSSEADQSSLDFDRHLMRRIDHNPRRFHRISLLSSIRV